MRHLSLALILGGLVLLSGCGGGGDAGQPAGDAGTVHTVSVGSATLQYSGQATPLLQVSGSGSTSSVAMAGASFTKFVYNPPKDALKLPLLICAGGTLCSYYAGQLNQIVGSNLGFVYSSSFTPTGQILLIAVVPSGEVQILACNQDGTGVKKILGNNQLSGITLTGTTVASMSPDGSKIAFDGLASGLPNVFICNANGSSPHSILIDCSTPSFSPDGQSLMWIDLSHSYLISGSTTGAINKVLASDEVGGGAWAPNST